MINTRAPDGANNMLSCEHFFMFLQYENARKKRPLQKVRTAGC